MTNSYGPMLKNTAQRIVFPILDSSGSPVTAAAGLDTEYSLDGGSFGDIADEAHEMATSSGVYYVDLAAGETNGNVVAIQCKTSTAGAKTTVLVFYTSSTTLDLIKTDTAAIKVMTDKVGTITNTGGTATIGAVLGDVANSAIAARLILIASYIDTEVADIKTMTDKIGTITNTGGTATIGAILGDFANSSLVTRIGTYLATINGKLPTNYIMGSAVQTAKDDEIDAIKAITDLLTLAAINAEVDTALSDVDLDHMVHTTIGAGKPTVGTLMDKVLNKNGSQTFDPTTDSLEAVRDNQAGADAAAIADAVWDEAVSGHTTGTTFGGTDAAVKAKTDLLPADTATQLDTNIPAIKAKTDLIGASVALETGGNLATIAGKLPTNKIMGSSVVTDKDDEIDAIKVMTDKIGTVTNTGGTATIGAILGDFANSALVTRIGTYLATINGKLPTNYIMGSAVLTAKDDEIDAIKAITDLLTLAAINAEVDTALNTAIPASNTATSVNDILLDVLTLAAINAEADTALSDVDLDHMVKTTIGAGKPTVGTLMDKVLNKSGSQTFDPTTDSLEAVRDNQAGADAAAIADAVWDEAVSGHTTGTTFGGTDAAVKAKTDLIGASVALETGGNVAAVKAKTDLIGASVALESAGNLAAVKAKTDLIPADITTQLDTNVPAIKAKTDLVGASVALESAGNLAAVKAKTDLIPADIVTQLDTNIPAVKAKTDIIGATVALESGGNLAAVLADTNELQTDWVNGGRLDLLVDLIITNVGVVDTVVDAIKAVTDLLTLGAIADAVHDEVTEGTTTLRQSIRLIDSALFGKLSGGGTGTLVFRDVDDTKNRITATVDASFNRTAVTKVAT